MTIRKYINVCIYNIYILFFNRIIRFIHIMDAFVFAFTLKALLCMSTIILNVEIDSRVSNDIEESICDSIVLASASREAADMRVCICVRVMRTE